MKNLIDRVRGLLDDCPAVTLRALPISVSPYRPPGLWAFTGADGPLLFRFPQPLHPLEAAAALRGYGGEEYSRPQLVRLALWRAGAWLAYTAVLAEYLNTTPQKCRLLWHLYTPLNVPSEPLESLIRGVAFPRLVWGEDRYAADPLGHRASAWATARSEARDNAGASFHRPAFWTEETKGALDNGV